MSHSGIVIDFITRTSVRSDPNFSILLVKQEQPIVNLIAMMGNMTYSINQFDSVNDVESWLSHNQNVDLIITDKSSGRPMVSIARSNLKHRVVPVLVTCNSEEIYSRGTALTAGVTDILITDGGIYNMQSTIRYYTDLKRRVLDADDQPPTATHRSGLPWWKRLIDVSVSLIVLLLLSPLLLIVALLIVIDSKGPILYKSKRAGTNFYVFNMYKFRTMKVKADQMIGSMASQNIYAKATPESVESVAGATQTNGTMTLCDLCRQRGTACQQPLFNETHPICEKLYLRESEDAAKFMKFRNDPRITRLGTFLRNSSIDELPQLFNILLGDMSLVGNRPLPLYEAEKLTSDEYAKRFAGPAGLTGLWQVKKRAQGQGPMSDRERTLLDIEYADTFSFTTDMQIIWQTIFRLWQKENV